MTICPLRLDFSVCQVKSADTWPQQGFFFFSRTDEENSLVCETQYAPEWCENREDGWKAFRIAGVLEFSLIGILARISALLAEEKIGIFAISTYNTDYILVKKEHFEHALETLSRAGYEIDG